MCGIVGQITERGFSASFEEDALASLHHRGPDEEGAWQSDGVFLGMRRLSIIDLAAPGWTEQGIRGLSARGQTGGGMASNPAPSESQIKSAPCVCCSIAGRRIKVAVRDSHRNAGTPGETKHIAAVIVDVAVYDVVSSLRGERTAEISRVAPRTRWIQAWDDVSAEGADFFVIWARLRRVDEEIHLKPLTVGMAKDVHEPCLDPAAPHASDDVQDSNSPRRALHLILPFFRA
jgi:hypothetical protein